MTSTTSTATEKKQEELRRYIELFAAAFDELHSEVVKYATKPGQYIRPHHDYPTMSKLDSGFSSFHDLGFYRDDSPRDYVGILRPKGLAGLLGDYPRPPLGLPKGAELAAFLRTHEIGKRLNLGALYDSPVDNLVGDAVERYLHLYGLKAPVEAKRRNAVIRPLVRGTVFQYLDLRLVVPITMTHFEVDHFTLTETTYVARIPERLQLGRARIGRLGTGAVRMVVGAATHAFVSNDWNLEVDNVDEVRRSLGQSSPNVLEAIDSFLGALRVATGISTGYAQMLWVPKHWSLDYFCDLTPVYGTTLRRYPDEYDNYGWVNRGATLTAEHLKEVRRIYRAVVGNESEGIRLALNRLNACLTRTDAADAILDGTIGLEVLLGDDENQSLSYKQLLRAAALSILHADPAFPLQRSFTKG